MFFKSKGYNLFSKIFLAIMITALVASLVLLAFALADNHVGNIKTMNIIIIVIVLLVMLFYAFEIIGTKILIKRAERLQNNK